MEPEILEIINKDSIFDAFESVKVIAVRQSNYERRLYEILDDWYAAVPLADRKEADIHNKKLLTIDLVDPIKQDNNKAIRAVIAEGLSNPYPQTVVRRAIDLSKIFDCVPVSFVCEKGFANFFEVDAVRGSCDLQITVEAFGTAGKVLRNWQLAAEKNIIKRPIQRVVLPRNDHRQP